MVICNKIFFFSLLIGIFLVLLPTNDSSTEINFKGFEEKKVSFLDFFLLKYEGTLIRRAQGLRFQLFVTRVQYSNIIVSVNFDKKEKKINTSIYAVMDKQRYSKKEYDQKMSDCNQVRNIIFYNRHGYKFFSQKRDPQLSENVMSEIFESVFLNNMNLSKEEINFLLDTMNVNVTVFHPVKKKEIVCSGKVNDYELK